MLPYCIGGSRVEVLRMLSYLRLWSTDCAFTNTKRQILFILTNALCAVVFAVAYPETKGKNLPASSPIVVYVRWLT